MGAVVSAFHATFVLAATWLVLLPIGVLRAFIICDMWAWFVVPLGLPQIGVLHAFGLSLFIGLFMDPSLSAMLAREDKEASLQVFAQSVFGWLFTWAAGAAIAVML
ncbi:hypothetical protein [Sphingosinicella humi]|uniref:Uncharacterized protein n=1 Tax=Allosphingosinicella humi TaxID=2068657 RepID=A0A2U2J4X6_9SPHN|nr:hypothetical protein [Sphingosinicella humi]PWG03362.1 hypothetical protein DF286_11145 [Sphingosinicella humi]